MLTAHPIVKRKRSSQAAFKRALSCRVAIIFLIALLSACASEQQLPVGAVLTISPPDRMLVVGDRTDENGVCLINPEAYIDWPVLLELTDASGAPIGDRDVKVYVDFGGNSFSGFPVMALYDDRRGNGNGLVDDFELINGRDDSIASVKTDSFGGDRELLIRINTSCPFRGEIFAFVQGVSAVATIEIAVESTASVGLGLGL